MAYPVHIITGPTGSGKTARALQAAAEKNGVIINADAMQTYADLRILSARPTEVEEQQAEHRLYGILDVFDPCTAARWVDIAAREIRQVWQENKTPILVGGTGMYIKSLMQGLSDIPGIPTDVRERVRSMKEPYAYLQQIDPEMAVRLKPGDSQRIARALEVMEATGTSLAEWQAKPMKPALPEADYTMEIIELAREELYARIDRRLDLMIEAGALEEVERLWQKVNNRFHQPCPHPSPPPAGGGGQSLPHRGRVGVGALQTRTYPVPKTLTHARDLRKNLTNAEQRLWRHIRSEQLGIRFRKQHPIGGYIADFACLQPQLIIELDGGQHNEDKAVIYDEKRTQFFMSQGFHVLRFWNNDILENMDGVLEIIIKTIQNYQSPPPSPPPAGGGMKDLSATYPLLRAHGVPEFFAYLGGTMKLAEAIDKAKQNTRNYAKRQMTWIRNQFTPANR